MLAILVWKRKAQKQVSIGDTTLNNILLVNFDLVYTRSFLKFQGYE
jgi:hypothetical protein